MNKEEQRARVDYKARSKKLREQFYQIAEEMVGSALELSKSGEDIRGNKERPGVSTYLHAAEKAIGEIVRLTPLCGSEALAETNKVILGWDQLKDETGDSASA